MKAKSKNWSENELSLLKEIQKFESLVFKKSLIKHHKLKNELHRIAHIYDRSVPTLRDDFNNYLLRTEPQIVKKLPGHKGPIKIGKMRVGKITYSPLLDKLIDTHAFDKFQFLYVN